MLNAFGIASDRQRDAAIEKLAKGVKAPEQEVRIPVVGADGEPDGRTVPAYAPPGETVVAVDLDDSEPPYTGLVTVSRSRRPKDGDIIVAVTDEGILRAGRLNRAECGLLTPTIRNCIVHAHTSHLDQRGLP